MFFHRFPKVKNLFSNSVGFFLYFTEKKCDYDDEIQTLGGEIYRITNVSLYKRFFLTYRFLKKHKNFYAIHSHTLLNSGTNVLAAFISDSVKNLPDCTGTSYTSL